MKAGHKPGSVHSTTEVGLQRVGGYLSGTDVAAGLERRVDAERGRWPATVPWPCSQPGFTEPAPLDAAGALLPHLCTLACARGSSHRPSAVCFCGTLLTVTRTGRYPASLAIGEPGLSSTDGRGQPVATTSPAFSLHHALWAYIGKQVIPCQWGCSSAG